MICCIPTKGRPHTKTYLIFEEANIVTYHFIEPQDWGSYEVPNKVKLPANDMGVGYARNFILEWCRSQREDICIMSDDDINSFGYVANEKAVKSDASIFHEMLPVIQKTPFEMYGMSFRQFAWAEKTKYSINSKPITGVVIVKPRKLLWKYPSTFKEDLIFQFETIRNGYGALKFNHFFFNCPAVGTNQGGCYDGYQKKEDESAAKRIMQIYHGFVRIVKKPKRIDIRWDFKKWAKHHKRDVR